MKKISISVFIVLATCIIVFLASIYCIIKISYNNQSKKILEETKQLLQNSENLEISNNITKKEEVILEDNKLGILIIPKLNIEAPIKDGTSQEVMKTSVGHFTESDYWNGNVSFASHNGGTHAHYFKQINILQENDEIEYITKLGRRKYKVEKIFEISSYDWTEIMSRKRKKYYYINNLH